MDPYKVLQVDKDAEPEVIEAAYKRLATKYHPDKNPSQSANQRMQRINAAYEVLRDAEQREKYDRSLEKEAARTLPPQPKTSDKTRSPARRFATRVQPKRSEPANTPPRRSEPTHTAPRRSEPNNAAPRRSEPTHSVPPPPTQPPRTEPIVWTPPPKRWTRSRMLLASVGVAALAVAGLGVHRAMQDGEHGDLESLQVRPQFERHLDKFLNDCKKGPKGPESTPGYCLCLAETMTQRFDYSEILAPTTEAFRDELASRIAACSPTEAEKSGCLRQQPPRAPAAGGAAVPATNATPTANTANTTIAPAARRRPASKSASPPESGKSRDSGGKASDDSGVVIHRDFPNDIR